jgi:hypothetical protein
LNPEFTKVFVFEYELGTPMRLAVSIFDEVNKGDNKAIGAAVFDVGEILGARGCTKAKRIAHGGTIFANVRKSEGTGMLRFKMKGIKLKSTEGMGFLRKSDPFFELSRQINSAGGATWDNVFRSEHIQNNLNPEWGDVVIELSTLCGGDLDLPIQVSIFDHESSGKHVLMGKFETSVNGLVKADTQGREDMGMAIPVTVKGKETGKVVVLKAQVAGTGESVSERMAKVSVSSSAPAVAGASPAPVATKPTFVDYISGGCELNVLVAVDFTGSNGDPRKPGTLHHRSSAMNDYEKAISAIVGVLSKYDSDQMFPVLGFGAKYDGVVNHCFQCGESEEVHGVKGVLEAYHQTFKSGLVMSSPTVFTEVIETAASRALSSQEKAKQKGQQAYTILLIVSDGAVSDSQATAAGLQQVCDAPLSIVIVGVGDADFSSMEFLDNANKPHQRDIAQFVQFNKHQTSSADLTSVTLREIPGQLVSYFQSKGIQPLPPIVAREEDIVVEDEEEEIDLTLDISEEGDIVVSGGGKDFRDSFA